jgi:hypothetical protein
MNNDTRREVLATYLDQRVVITGVFERLTINKNPHKPFKVALLQDVEVELSRAKHDLGHVWIQHAENLDGFKNGDRIRCSCRVGKYHRTVANPDGNGVTTRTDYSLSYPNEVRLLGKPVALRIATDENGSPAGPGPATAAAAAEAPVVVPEEEPVKTTDPVQLILTVKELAQKVGGWERIVELKEYIAKVGGWDRVLEIQELAEEVGGWDRLEHLLSLLKL